MDIDESPLAGKRVGLIGLGLMGKPMARLLVGAGAELTVANRSPAALEELEEEGAKVAGSPADLVALLEGGVVILMLKDAAVVREVAEGPLGILGHVRKGTVVVDMGTTSPRVTRWLAESLAERGCSLVDAPVSGGEKGAIEGTLTVMAGGSREDFDRVKPVLEVLGSRITWMGESGAGQVTKLANQVIVATTIDAVAEALRMAEAAGVDPARVREALRGGFAESRILEMHGERMVRGDFAPGGKATGQLKDLRYAQELLEDSGINLPGVDAQISIWEAMVESGMGELDHSGLYAYLGKINAEDGSKGEASVVGD